MLRAVEVCPGRGVFPGAWVCLRGRGCVSGGVGVCPGKCYGALHGVGVSWSLLYSYRIVGVYFN